MVLILNEQSAWLYLPILTDSLKMDYPFQIAWVQSPPSPSPLPHRHPFSDFFRGEGAAVHRLSETKLHAKPKHASGEVGSRENQGRKPEKKK